jgi:hypothetical protein
VTRREREEREQRRGTPVFLPGTIPKKIAETATRESVGGKKLLSVRRVSGEKQKRQGNLENQKVVRKEADRYGASIVGDLEWVGHASDPEFHKAIADKAEETGADGVIVTTNCRLLRHPEWNWEENQPYTDEQADAFLETIGVPCYTVLDSEADKWTVRAYQSAIGQTGKHSGPGGRGKKRRPADVYRSRKKSRKDDAVRMRKEGSSYGEIATVIGVPKTTVYRWLKGG